MRLVNLAHGDLIVLAAYLILGWSSRARPASVPGGADRRAADVRARLGAADLVLNRVLGDDILPPLLVTFGLSVAMQNGLLEGFSADSRASGRRARDARRCISGRSRSASCRC